MMLHSKLNHIIHNDYMTPKYAWENISHLIGEKYKIIWESAYGDGLSGQYWREIFPNKTIIHKPIDYFSDISFNYDIEISNIPFGLSKEWFLKAKERGKPFIILCPTGKLTTQYFREIFSGEKIQIIIPKKRIHFIKKINGKIPPKWKAACYFDCFYYCWQMGFKNDINWLF